MDDRQCNMYPGNKNGPVETRNQESNDRILIGLSVFNIFLWLLCTTFSVSNNFNYFLFLDIETDFVNWNLQIIRH